MYRNVYYSPKERCIHLFGWDSEGNRTEDQIDFKPYLFIESTKASSNYRSIFGKPLALRQFDTSWERRNYVDDTDKRTYFNLPPEQQFLLSRYWQTDREKFTENPLRVFTLDIECPSPDSFPEPTEAKVPINAITIHDSDTDTFHVWGAEPFDPECVTDYDFESNRYMKPLTPDRIKYYHCPVEADLLMSFIDFWEANYPDVVTDWNGEAFDIPYIVNRVIRVHDRDTANRLSPVRDIYHRVYPDKWGNPIETYKIRALSHLDYLKVFQTFTLFKERESWRLDDVASDELGVGKLDYGASNLYNLAKEDWSKFVAYNIQDVNLLVGLDRKKNFLDFARVCAYEGFSQLEEATGKISIIVGAVAKMALDRGQILYTRKPSDRVGFEGGFVKEPNWGIHTDLISYDITSLYPTNMMVCNMSPETKRGKVVNWDELEYMETPRYEVEITGKGRKAMSKSEFKSFCFDHSLACSGAGILFSQTQSGVVSDFVKHIFTKKQEADTKKREARNMLAAMEDDPDANVQSGVAHLEREIAKAELERSLWKVLANSIYGVVSNNVSALYDLDIARSVTLTGQRVIQRGYDIVREFSHEKFGVDPEEQDMIVASDTDSMMVSLTPVLKTGKLGDLQLFEDDKLTDSGKRLLDVYQDRINTDINHWARNTMFTTKELYNFEREKVCPAALFLAKKNYAYHVLNNEGEDCDEVKYTGLRTVKSEFSGFAKQLLDDVYTHILKRYSTDGETLTRSDTVQLAREGKERFISSPPDEIVRRQKANNLQKWPDEDGNGMFAVKGGCPPQARAAIIHNALLKEFNVVGKYPAIQSGDKVKWGYVKRNPFNIKYIAYLDELPQEFGLEIDAEVQYDKVVGSAINKAFEVLKWRAAHLDITDEVDLWDIFASK